MYLEQYLLKRIDQCERNQSRKECLVIAYDFDGVLCESNWNQPDPKPNLHEIERLNRLSKKHFIVVHTARSISLATQTIEWLNRHNVRYSAISFNKMQADVYVDDKSFNPNQEPKDDPYP